MRRALDADGAFAVGLKVARIDFKLFRRRFQHDPARLARRRHHCVADAMRATRGE